MQTVGYDGSQLPLDDLGVGVVVCPRLGVAVGALGAGLAVAAGWVVLPLQVAGDQRPMLAFIASVWARLYAVCRWYDRS